MTAPLALDLLHRASVPEPGRQEASEAQWNKAFVMNRGLLQQKLIPLAARV